MKKLCVLIAILMLALTHLAISQDIVQLSSELDASGKFTNWQEQPVTWEPGTVTDVPDHMAIDSDVLQEWYVPNAIGQYLKFSFDRVTRGLYAIRWSRDGLIWSEPQSVVAVRPGSPVHSM